MNQNFPEEIISILWLEELENDSSSKLKLRSKHSKLTEYTIYCDLDDDGQISQSKLHFFRKVKINKNREYLIDEIFLFNTIKEKVDIIDFIERKFLKIICSLYD